MTKPNPNNFALDVDGNPLPYSPADVAKISDRALEEGDLVLAILRMPSGDLACHVMGDPDPEIADLIEQVATAYRRGITPRG